MTYTAVRFHETLDKFSEYWTPKIVAAMNDYHLKLVKLKGEFVWHSHEETDEVFIVLKGKMCIEFRDGSLTLQEGEMYVVPRGVEHKPSAEQECSVLLLEPAGTINTGNSGSDLTAPDNSWI